MPTAHPPRPRWPWRAIIAITLVALAAAWLAHSRARAEPAWWIASNPRDPRVVRNAEEVEGAAMAQMTALRDGTTPWSVSLQERDACDWLAARLPIWLTSRGMEMPKEVRAVRVSFAAEGVYIGVKMEGPAAEVGGRVAWVLVQPRVDEQGLWMPATNAGIGRTELPLATALSTITLPKAITSSPNAPDVIAILKGQTPATPNPETQVDPSRRVRLKSLTSRSGVLILEARTE